MTEETLSADTASTDSSPDWRESLSPEQRELQIVKDTPDIPTLVKRLQDTQAMVGSSVRIPTDAAGQDDITAFNQKVLEKEYLGLMQRPDQTNPEVMSQVYNSLGRPEEASGYTAPESVDAETFGALAGKAHELGLSDAQYGGMAAALNEIQSQQVQQMNTEREQGVAQVRGEWGQAFDQKVDRVRSVVKALGGHSKLEQALSEGVADAETLLLFDKIAQQIGSEGTEIAKQMTQVSQQTVSELVQRRDELGSRLLNESLTPAVRQELMNERVELSARIAAVGN